MGLYLYGVTRPDNAPGPTLAGMGGTEVRRLEIAGLGIWAETMERKPEAALESVRDHHRVVAAAADGGPVLPLRFGQWVPDASAVEETLDRRRRAYEEALDRVEGAVEVGLRIVDPDLPSAREAAAVAAGAGADDSQAPSPGKGRAYLEALRERERKRAERRRRGEELARELSEELDLVLRGERIVESPSDEGSLVSLAHLVRREDLERHEKEVRRFRKRHPRLQVVSSGPWPPYSFTPGEMGLDPVEEDGKA